MGYSGAAFGHNARMTRALPPVLSRLKPLMLRAAALLCWLLQYGSVQQAAGQVAPLFQAAISVAWAMLLLWLWSRWRGIGLFAQGASLWSALWSGALFTLQWACLYLAVDRQSLWRVALNFLLMLLVLRALRAAQGAARRPWGMATLGAARRWPVVLLGLLGAIGVLWLGAWSWKNAQGGAWLLALVAAWSFATGFRHTCGAQMAPRDLLRWRFYQLSVGALLLPLMAVAFSPSWNFIPGGSALAAMLLQAVCGGLAFPFLLAWASPHARNEAAGDAHIADVIRPDAA